MRQQQDAIHWKNTCLEYFQQFSGLPIPDSVADVTHPQTKIEQ
jgi:hypothetical protein